MPGAARKLVDRLVGWWAGGRGRMARWVVRLRMTAMLEERKPIAGT